MIVVKCNRMPSKERVELAPQFSGLKLYSLLLSIMLILATCNSLCGQEKKKFCFLNYMISNTGHVQHSMVKGKPHLRTFIIYSKPTSS